MVIDWSATMHQLAIERPLFHSEADFQHALAWKLHEIHSHARVRLEYRPFVDERIYIDIWMGIRPDPIAIELKYLTRGLSVQIDEEQFNLANQAAQDLSRYDVVKDIVRLERVCRERRAGAGYAVLLTNDQGYWQHSPRSTTVDAAFRVHEGRILTGDVSWSVVASKGTTRGREESLKLQGSYQIQWKDYSLVTHAPGGRFRYLVVEVLPDAGADR
jgi:hypothetical protein